MKNDFQQLVDRNLSGLQWDERRRQRVLRSLEPEGGTTMKRKLTLTIALAAALVLIASVAVAAVMLNYSPEVAALTIARKAVMEKYGLTHTTMGLFTYDMQLLSDQTIVIFHSDVVDSAVEGAAGIYTIVIPDNGDASAAWSYDSADPALWQTGQLDSPIWGQPQLVRFLQEKTMGGTVIHDTSMYTAAVCSSPTPLPISPEEEVLVENRELVPAPDELSEADAIELARTALMDTFDLTEDDMAQTDIFHWTLEQYSDDQPRAWHIWAYLKHEGYDWNMYVSIDASTGEIIDIGMTTGGNG